MSDAPIMSWEQADQIMEDQRLAIARLSAANKWLQGEVLRLRLTDAERIAIKTAIVYLKEDDDFPGIAEDRATLLALLERMK